VISSLIKSKLGAKRVPRRYQSSLLAASRERTPDYPTSRVRARHPRHEGEPPLVGCAINRIKRPRSRNVNYRSCSCSRSRHSCFFRRRSRCVLLQPRQSALYNSFRATGCKLRCTKHAGTSFAIATAGSKSASGLGTIINYTTSARRRGARNRLRYVPALVQIEKSPCPKITLPPTGSLTSGLFRYPSCHSRIRIRS